MRDVTPRAVAIVALSISQDEPSSNKALRKHHGLVNTKPGTGRKSDSVFLVS